MHFRRGLLLLCLCFAAGKTAAADDAADAQRHAFEQAWQAAGRGERQAFQQALPGLRDYLLYPYLQYEDLRFRRGQVAPQEMARFLSEHEDWAFAAPLRTSWLKTLADQGRWALLLEQAGESQDTELRCQLARARLETADTSNLLPEAQALWAVGRSQPEECDPVFRWLQDQGGITPGLAWERIRLAMEERQPRLTLYLARFLPESERVWVDRWYQQDRAGYSSIGQAAGWPQSEPRRQISDYGLRRLARRDPDQAWAQYLALRDRIDWTEDERAGIVREIALWSAVDGATGTPERMQAVPRDARDDRLLEWWARYDLARGDWNGVLRTLSVMSDTARDDGRWRYWKARALLETGQPEAGEALLSELAQEASYHGFLAADRLGLPYRICAEPPGLGEAEVQAMAQKPGIRRALELRRAGVRNWARSEWMRVTRREDRQGLRAAAAVAVRENWPDMAIYALGDSGDRQWYEWRFPLNYEALVDAAVGPQRLDSAWVLGLMRSESAMAEDALSPAGAYGLMQVTPGTAQQVSKRHGIPYNGREQLWRPADNVRFGTTYLREHGLAD